MSVASIVKASALLFGACEIACAAARAGRGLHLRGKTAVVCGASRGLGRAVALELARRGAKLAVCARSETDLDQVRREIASLGAEVYAAPCDLRFEDDVAMFVAGARSRLGPIDLLVCNAATIEVGPVETMTARDFDHAMEAIFETSLHPTLAVLPEMRARRSGTIAFVTSIGGKIGVPHLAPYCAAKFAEVGLAESLRGELSKDHVHVLTVIPGLMRTGSHVHARFKGDSAKELAWFGASATAPLLTIDADRAARRIVRAIERGDHELVYTLPARVAVRLHDLLPTAFAVATRLAGRLLPGAPPPSPARPHASREDAGTEGVDVIARSRSKLVAAVAKRSKPLVARHAQ
jgi:short-subunit dehydrogenase